MTELKRQLNESNAKSREYASRVIEEKKLGSQKESELNNEIAKKENEIAELKKEIEEKEA